MLPAPKSPYAASKLAGEHLCRAFYESYGLETIILRYFNVFGPYQNSHSQYAAVIPRTKELLGYQLKIRFREGFRKTVEWFKDKLSK